MIIPQRWASPLASFIIFAASVSLLSLIFINRANVPGKVVILNGISSSGKTSIIIELQKLVGDSFVVMDIDTFQVGYTASHPFPDEKELNKLDEKAKKELGQEYTRTFVKDFYSSISDKALKGYNVLVDTVPSLDSDDEQINDILKNLKVNKVYCIVR